MAKQESILKFTGNIGDLNFFKSKDGYSARKKGGVSGDRIKNDPKFERTRENIEEFGRAAVASKLLRSALRSVLLNNKDSRMSPRLTKVFLEVLQADAVNRRGKRIVNEGHLPLLEKFQFNLASPLDRTFNALFDHAVNRAQGSLQIMIPEMSPALAVVWPEGATHCRLRSAAAELDFVNGKFQVSVMASDSIERYLPTLPQSLITHNLPAGSELPMLITLGLEFFQFLNGELYPLKNGSFNSHAVVAVSIP